MTDRREFLLGLAKGAGAAVVGGLVWVGYLDGKKASATVLRPPGAVEEERFLAACTKCGLCVAAPIRRSFWRAPAMVGRSELPIS